MRCGHAVLALLMCACSGGSSASSTARDEAGSDATAPAVVPVPAARAIGLGSLDGFAYRRGPGRGDYDRAVKVEKRARGDDDWRAVVDACRAALAADPGHLDAAWLEAAALARQGKHDEILPPLSMAVAGDWAKWGERSLTLPLFGDFLASPSGAAWKQLAEEYRGAFATAARGAVIVLGRDAARVVGQGAELDRRAEVYAWAPSSKRWLRLTHTGGTVIAALPAADAGLVAYVAYRQLGKAVDKATAIASPSVAVVDLATGRVSREMPFLDVTELRLWWKPGAEPMLAATIKAPKGAPSAGTWVLDWKREHAKRPAAGQKVVYNRDNLVVTRGVARRVRTPAEISADWDDHGLASAIRLDDTRKTVTPPAGLVVEGDGLVWSPDRARLALVAVDETDCAAPAKVFVVDAGTGKLRELGAAPAPAPAWIDATHLAYTAGDRVRVVDVTTSKFEELTSAAGVATAIVSRPCAPPSDEALFAPAPDDPEPEFADLTPSSRDGEGATSAPTDAGPAVVNDAQSGGPPTPADSPN